MTHYSFELTTLQGREKLEGTATSDDLARVEAVRFMSDVLRDQAMTGCIASVQIDVFRDEELVVRVVFAVDEVSPLC